jgi:uncharacterized protein with PIN domain
VTYLLDTNAVIALLKNQPNAVRKQLRRAAAKGASIRVSSVVMFELWYGVARSERRRENAERLRVFLSGTKRMSRSSRVLAVSSGRTGPQKADGASRLWGLPAAPDPRMHPYT